MFKTLTLEHALSAISNTSAGSSDFDLNSGVALPEKRVLRPAAVLVLVAQQEGKWGIYLTKRSSALQHHPGQIAFPGGKKDPTDPSLEATALREAYEEIGLPADQTKVIGRLPEHETVTQFLMTPIVAVLQQDFDVKPETGEVDEVFFVPLTHVLNETAFQVQSRLWQGRTRSYYAVPYGPYYIWGATARILKTWAAAVRIS